MLKSIAMAIATSTMVTPITMGQTYERIERPSDERIEKLREKLVTNYGAIRDLEIEIDSHVMMRRWTESFVTELGGRWTDSRHSPFKLSVDLFRTTYPEGEATNSKDVKPLVDHYQVKLRDDSQNVVLSDVIVKVECLTSSGQTRIGHCIVAPEVGRDILAELGAPDF